MKRLIKWSLVALASLALSLTVLLAPVLYVETFCGGDGVPKPYNAQISSDHHRPESRTLMTYPEWHIVHAYEDFAKVIAEGDPHEYGFLKSIYGFWSSLCSLSKASSSLGEVDGDTKTMVYVIGVSFSLELGLKAAYEETIGRVFTLLRGSERAPLDELSAHQAKNYATFLQQVPWYKWRFRDDEEELDSAATGVIRDIERNIALGLEYKAKAAYADLIASAVAATGNDALTLRMIVSGANRQRLESYQDVMFVQDVSHGTIIETPRYRALTNLLDQMANDGLEFVEIAGNDDILFTAISDSDVFPGAIATMTRQGFNNYRHLVLVSVPELAEQLRSLNVSNVRLEHIHDY